MVVYVLFVIVGAVIGALMWNLILEYNKRVEWVNVQERQWKQEMKEQFWSHKHNSDGDTEVDGRKRGVTRG